MKNKLLLIALICFPFLINAQTFIKAQLLDSLSKEPIAFVNVGIISKATGTVSDENGNFELTIPDSLGAEKLRFSCIGYKSITIPANKLTNTSLIYLSQQSTKLKEITISKKQKVVTKTLGNNTNTKKIVWQFKSNKLGTEIAIPIKIKHPQTKLKKVQFNIVSNPIDSLLFRFNLYKINSNGYPGENILDQLILIKPTSKTGRVELDLDKYNIYTDSSVFIAIEWMKDFGFDNSGLYFSATILNSDTYYREVSQDIWKKSNFGGFGLSAVVEY